MLKNDYMKEVENSLRILKMEVDKNLKDGNIEKCKELINKQFRALIGLDIETIDTLSFETVKELLSKDNQYNAEKYIALGELLKLEGLVSEKEGDISKKLFYYEKIVDSFFQGYEEDEAIDKKYINESKKEIEELMEYEIPIRIQKKIFKLYELLGSFDKAEDLLFQMIEDTNKDKEIIEEGKAFYNRLKELSKDLLEEGNFSFEELKKACINYKLVQVFFVVNYYAFLISLTIIFSTVSCKEANSSFESLEVSIGAWIITSTLEDLIFPPPLASKRL